MAKKSNAKANPHVIRYLKPLLIFGYGLIILIAVAILSRLAIVKTDTVLKNKVSSMASSLNVQMKLNLNSYLDRIETVSTLIFASEEAYTYDATNTALDEYDVLETENEITNKLYDLCTMDNFVDFGIVYSNNHTIGKISNGTKDQFGDKIYDLLSAIITNDRTYDGWAAGYRDNFKRIYYVKRLNDNAILVVSVYSTELAAVFNNPEALDGTEIRLTNPNNDIIYSSVSLKEAGTKLPEKIASAVGNETSAAIMDEDYLITVNESKNDWCVICSIPTEIILKEKNDMYKYIYIAAALIALIAVLIGTFLSVKITDPISDVVTNLDSKAHADQLTGLFNKRSFEENIEKRIEEGGVESRHAMLLIDVDSFNELKNKNDKAYSDNALKKVSEVLRNEFTQGELLGRTGEDEFGVFVSFDDMDKNSVKESAKSICEKLIECFHEEAEEEDALKLTVSIGVSLSAEKIKDYPKLYNTASTALETAKNRGKDTYVFYEKYLEGVLKK